MNALNIPIDIDKVLAGRKTAVAKALNLVENRSTAYAGAVSELTEAICTKSRHSRHLIGISGPPGVGKSSMISRLIEKYRTQNKTVGVLSVDPSSKKSGGALLGDRIRIQYDPNDPGVFIRSMAAGQHLGGLALNTRLNLMVFEAVYDIIILETVGVGQSETEIEHMVDSVVIVIQPGSGDLLQFMKAGIMEIPHLLVINKADHKELAMKTFNDLTHATMFESPISQGWKMEVLMTSAQKDSGFEDFVRLMDLHRAFLEDNDISGKRMKNLYWWMISSFKERFGSFGIDMVGSEEDAMVFLRESEITNPLTGMQLLTNLFYEKLKLT